MTIPSNITSQNSLGFPSNNNFMGGELKYYDSEMKEGEIGSRQFVTLLDVIAEGEIAGFPSAISCWSHTRNKCL